MADFRSAADKAFKRLEELRAERAERVPERKPEPEIKPEDLRKAPYAPAVSSLRFLADGTPVSVLEKDGDVLLAEVRGEEKLLSREEVLPLSRLPFRAALRALRAAEISAVSAAASLPGRGFLTDAPYYGISPRSPRGGSVRTLCYFRNVLCAPFSKQRGTRTYYAPLTEEEAERVFSGEADLRYVKNSNRFVVR